MKIAKILFCAMAMVASACFVSCTTSEVDKIEEAANKDFPGLRVEAQSASIKAGQSSLSVTASDNTLTVSNLSNADAGQTVSLAVKPTAAGMSATVDMPATASAELALTTLKPNQAYVVTYPSGKTEKFTASSTGAYTLKNVTKGEYVISAVTHSGGAAN